MKKRITYICLLVLLCLQFSKVQAQKDVISLFKNQLKLAQKYYAEFSYKDAVTSYKNVYKKHKEDSIRLKIALCYDKLNDPNQSTFWFEAIKNKEKYISDIEKLIYEKNKIQLDNNPKISRLSASYLSDSAKIFSNGNSFFKEFFKDSSRYEIQNLTINSADDDFGAAMFQNSLLYLSSRKPSLPIKEKYNWNDGYFISFFKSDFREDGSLSHSNEVAIDIDKNVHKGPFVTFDSGKQILFTGNYTNKTTLNGLNRLGIYVSEILNDKILNPKPLNISNPDYSVGHPAITSTGKIIFFVSDMPGGYGGTDIYSCKFENNTCYDVQNMGPVINTKGNEMFPFVFQDSILFFSSSGHPGVGGLDIFYILLDDKNAIPQNMRYPINSGRDDFSFTLAPKGNFGFFSSTRPGGKGGDDIYSFRINSRQLKLVFKDIEDDTAIEDVNVIVEASNYQSVPVDSSEKGSLTYYIYSDIKYRFIISKESYNKEVIDFQYNINDPKFPGQLEIFLKNNND